MPRHFTASESQLKPDPRFQDKVLAKFINCLMEGGEKATAQRVMYAALDAIQVKLEKEKPENLPPFSCIDTYDGKVWKYIPKNTGKNILFWNVGKEPVLNDPTIYERVNSYRDWIKNDVQYRQLDI